MSEPFIKRARAAYYLSWVPMTAMVGLVLALKGIDIWPAMAISIPLCTIYALVCGSTYYLARAWPINRAGFLKVVTNLFFATAFSGGAFSGLFFLVSQFLTEPLSGQLANQLDILFGVGAAYFALSLVFHYLMIALVKIRRAETKANEANVLTREAELRALRAQLDPHFLFNSLNSIAALTGSEPNEARKMCQLLSDFLRLTMKVSDTKILTLGEELELVRKYLEIEEVRFGDRMKIDFVVEDSCNHTKVPALLLQPLVENAVKHGIAESNEGGVIKITTASAGLFVKVSIENAIETNEPQTSTNRGRGLSIATERLRSFYGDKAEMVVEKKDGCFLVTLKLPTDVLSERV